MVPLHPDKMGTFTQIVYVSSSHKSRHVLSSPINKTLVFKGCSTQPFAMVSFNRNQKEILLFMSDFMKFLLYAHRSIQPFQMHYHMLFCSGVNSYLYMIPVKVVKMSTVLFLWIDSCVSPQILYTFSKSLFHTTLFLFVLSTESSF